LLKKGLLGQNFLFRDGRTRPRRQGPRSNRGGGFFLRQTAPGDRAAERSSYPQNSSKTCVAGTFGVKKAAPSPWRAKWNATPIWPFQVSDAKKIHRRGCGHDVRKSDGGLRRGLRGFDRRGCRFAYDAGTIHDLKQHLDPWMVGSSLYSEKWNVQRAKEWRCFCGTVTPGAAGSCRRGFNLQSAPKLLCEPRGL
jgi:hypothetical protein